MSFFSFSLTTTTTTFTSNSNQTASTDAPLTALALMTAASSKSSEDAVRDCGVGIIKEMTNTKMTKTNKKDLAACIKILQRKGNNCAKRVADAGIKVLQEAMRKMHETRELYEKQDKELLKRIKWCDELLKRDVKEFVNREYSKIYKQRCERCERYEKAFSTCVEAYRTFLRNPSEETKKAHEGSEKEFKKAEKSRDIADKILADLYQKCEQRVKQRLVEARAEHETLKTKREFEEKPFYQRLSQIDACIKILEEAGADVAEQAASVQQAAQSITPPNVQKEKGGTEKVGQSNKRKATVSSSQQNGKKQKAEKAAAEDVLFNTEIKGSKEKKSKSARRSPSPQVQPLDDIPIEPPSVKSFAENSLHRFVLLNPEATLTDIQAFVKDNSVDVSTIDRGWTVAELMLMHAHPATGSFLLEYSKKLKEQVLKHRIGAFENPDAPGFSLMQLACFDRRGYTDDLMRDVFHALITMQFPVNEPEDRLPLHLAALHGNAPAVRMLLNDPRIDCNSESSTSHSALLYASMSNSAAVFREFEAAYENRIKNHRGPPDFHHVDDGVKENFLHWAVYYESWDVVTWYLNRVQHSAIEGFKDIISQKNKKGQYCDDLIKEVNSKTGKISAEAKAAQDMKLKLKEMRERLSE